jgi:hypothetical protein
MSGNPSLFEAVRRSPSSSPGSSTMTTSGRKPPARGDAGLPGVAGLLVGRGQPAADDVEVGR